MKNSTKRSILHFFFPNRCPVCGEVIFANDSFCEKCLSELDPANEDFSIDAAVSFTAVFAYNEKIKPAVILMKNGTSGNSPYALGTALAERISQKGIAEKLDMIVPVPMLKANIRKRGYNQAELIGIEVSRILNVPIHNDIIRKSRKTADQKTLSKAERMNNLKGAFTVTAPEFIKGKNILLVDDVCTTGSTLAELTKLLINNGAHEVHCAACCKT